MNRAPALALLLGLAHCASSASPRRTIAHAPPPPAQSAPRAAESGPAWRLLAPRDLPSPLGDVAGLAGHDAVVLAAGAIYRWHDGHASPVCQDFSPIPSIVAGDGDGFVALGIDRDGEAYAWHSSDRGAQCERTQLPGLVVANVPPEREYGVDLQGSLALAWNPNGAALRSNDGGVSWSRLPILPGVAGVWRRGSLGLVAVARVGNGGSVSDARRVRLFVLGTEATATWRPVETGRDRRLPLEIGDAPDGSALLGDAIGTGTLAADGRFVNDAPTPVFHLAADAPLSIVRAGAGRFAGISSRAVFTLDASGVRPFSPATLGLVGSFGASDDGDVWCATPARLYHTTVGRPLVEVTSSPLGDAVPRRVVAAGARIAIVATDGTVARSDDDGAHWSRTRLPDALGEAVAAAFSSRGELLVLGTRGLAVSDGRAFELVALPEGDPDSIAQPALFTAGDRWIVVQDGVLTSDDQGAHWQRRPLDPAAAIDPLPAGASFRAGIGVVLDVANRVYRTDDAASTFASVGGLEAASPGVPTSPGRIAWDGGRNLAIVERQSVLRSSDGGATWQRPHDRAHSVDLLDPTFAPGGRLVGMRSYATCAHDGSEVGESIGLTPWFADSDSATSAALCEHPAAAWAFDGDSVVVATSTASVWRGSLRALAPPIR